MKLPKLSVVSFYIFSILFVCSIISYFQSQPSSSHLGNECRSQFESGKNLDASTSKSEEINIAMVICGDKSLIDAAMAMMKSAILFRETLHINFVIVCQNHLRQEIYTTMETFRLGVGHVFTYELHNTAFPEANETFWRTSFAECSTQRLFFPNMFLHIEKLLYVDTDVLFLNGLTDIWHYSYEMNQSQMIAIGPGHPNPVKYAERFHPQYPLSEAKLINSGVMIMDLEKMRQFGWVPLILKIYGMYQPILVLTDQDLMRLAFFSHPRVLYSLPCNYNYHGAACKSILLRCIEAETQGIYFLHGAGSFKHKNKMFKAFTQFFQEPTAHYIAIWNRAPKTGVKCEVFDGNKSFISMAWRKKGLSAFYNYFLKWKLT